MYTKMQAHVKRLLRRLFGCHGQPKQQTMTTKRPDSFEGFQRKQAAKRTAELPPPSHNEPRDLPSLSHEEITYVDAAREALVTIKRTFEFWIVIARAG